MIGRRSFLVASTLLIGLAGAQNAVAQTLSVGGIYGGVWAD